MLVSATTPAHASTTYTVNVLHSAVLVNPENPIQAKFAEHPFPDSSKDGLQALTEEGFLPNAMRVLAVIRVLLGSDGRSTRRPRRGSGR